jgi:hypothetical protein
VDLSNTAVNVTDTVYRTRATLPGGLPQGYTNDTNVTCEFKTFSDNPYDSLSNETIASSVASMSFMDSNGTIHVTGLQQ